MLAMMLILAATNPAEDHRHADQVAPIRSVVVYEDRAEVTRRGRHGCPGGQVSMTIEPLPISVDVESLRVGTDAGRVLGVETRTKIVKPKKERARLDQARERLEEDKRAAQSRFRRAQDAIEKLERYAALAERSANETLRSARPDLKGVEAAIDAVHARRQRELEASRAARAAIDVLDRELNEMVTAFARLGGGRQALGVDVLIGCERSGTLTVAYQVPHASWRPEYDLHFRPKAKHGVGPGRFELGVSATVRQSTGEHWRGVRLRLSTARPRLAADAPEPAPFVLGSRRKSDRNVLVQARERRPSLRRGSDSGRGEAKDVGLIDRGQVVLLEIPHPVTVGSDGRGRFIPVDEIRGPARAGLVAIPARSRGVFRELALENRARYPLLPGPARIYRGDALVGQITIELLPPGAEVRLSLGLDARFRVTREDLVDLAKVRGVFSKSRVLERSLRTEVVSQAEVVLPVEIRQQIPVARSEAVKVELDREKTSPGFSVDGTRGHVFWTVRPEPGNGAEVDLTYRVELPEAWAVN